ncbi:TetR family transcriptional regulator [Williamsia limnetica]|uniref:TetR family transcriptional regulator n=1 Tax=Williamsia limnetica TaxID=882452 RepID=A0A318RE59_WILLI|nr:TetR/AcrR family transcriptional regulator [Williamsia limnetica]PYE12285.1 TetR family transcriptional regulator [Williamsia limnetica]
MSVTASGTDAIPCVVDGVFFTRPPRLPRGPHRLARAAITLAQRERFLIAFTELLAARGYYNVTISDIATRSGTSKTAFYGCFPSLEECAEAAYDRFVEVLLHGMSGYSDTPIGERGVEVTIMSYLSMLERDLVVARAFQLELNNEGRLGRTKRRTALVKFAELVRAEHQGMARRDDTMASTLPLDAYLAIVYAVRQFASDALDETAHPDLSGIASRLGPWITASLRG